MLEGTGKNGSNIAFVDGIEGGNDRENENWREKEENPPDENKKLVASTI